nr:vernalization insensitive 3-like 1 [Lilium hybrid cultivar]
MSEKNYGEHIDETDTILHLCAPLPPPPPHPQPPLKRQRKTDHPLRLSDVTSSLALINDNEAQKSIEYCLNLACRAAVSQEYAFCKRCSCCICHKYDDNKDPSLWLVCSSEAPYEGDSCGFSCHVECALKHERTGISKNGHSARLDGNYYCIYCGKVNDLLGCWRKQLVIAKDARRVDVLCYRVSLSHKLLSSTTKHRALHEIVDVAMKKLESEVGLLSGLPSMTRGIVNRLSVGAEVQKLCASAVELVDSMLPCALPVDTQIGKTRPSFVKFEYVSPTSVTLVLGPANDPSLPPNLIGFTLWLRKADVADYLTEPTRTLVKAEGRFLISDLTPATEYIIKVIAFNSTIELAKWEVSIKTDSISKDIKSSVGKGISIKRHRESQKIIKSGRSTPPSEGDESISTHAYGDLNKMPDGIFGRPENIDLTRGESGSALDEEPNSMIETVTEHNNVSDIPKSDNDSNTPTENEMAVVPHVISKSAQPVTPCRVDTGKEGGRSVKPTQNLPPRPEMEPGSSSKKRFGVVGEDNSIIDGSAGGGYEYCVKVIRWLECEGHIETNFRVKLLTWFSLQASTQEKRVLNAYVNTLIDDPMSLAGQLADTFAEAVHSKRSPPVATGFCSRLWH